MNPAPKPYRLEPSDPAARVLASEKARRALAPFLNRSRGLAEAAREAGISRQALRYWVRKFEQLGLLERKDGGPRPRWRAAASTFLLPFAADPASAGVREWLERRHAPDHEALLEAAARRLEELGLDHLVLTARDGEPFTQAADAYGRTGMESGLLDGFSGALELSDADANALHRELVELWTRYRHRRGRGRRLRVYAFLVEEPPSGGS